MKKIKVLMFVVVLVMLAAAFVGCAAPAAETEKPAETKAAETKPAETKAAETATAETASTTQAAGGVASADGQDITIGVIFDFLQVERRVIAKEYLEKYADEAGVELIFLDANGDEKVQLQQAENLITKEVDVLVVLAQNADAASPMVEQAKEAGIPFVAIDRMIANADVDYYIGINNDNIGDMMAQYVYDLCPKGNYILISGAPTDPNCKTYKDGWMRVIGDAVDKGDIKIVGDADTENWDPNNAYKNVENFLTKNNDDVDVILAMNDGTGGGSVQALKGRGLDGKVLVTGQDGELAACQRIVEGTQAMTVWKPDNEISRLTIDSCVKIAKGEQPDINGSINNGMKDVPSVLIEPVAVDKNNMDDTIIAAGYYPKEDVYANVK